MIKQLKGIDLREPTLLLVAVFPILKFNFASMAIMLFGVTSVFFFIKNKERFDPLYLKHFLLNSLFLLLLWLTLTYSSDVGYGLKTTQHSLSLVVFPLIIFFFLPRITPELTRRILDVFTLTCFILTVYIYIGLFKGNAFSKVFNGNTEFWNNPFREILFNLELIDVHPTYYTLWILFSAVYLISRCFEKTKAISYFYMALGILFFTGTALLFSARAPLLAFFVAVFFLLVAQFKKNRHRLGVSLLVVFIAVFSITQISVLKTRFVDEFQAQKFSPPVGNAHTSTNIRVGIYTCVYQIFMENKWFGVGVGDVKQELDNCYLQFHTRVYDQGYNTHSSYFNLLLSGGLVALIFFGWALVYQFRTAISAQYYLYVAFLIMVCCTMLFENVFARMHGALFFGLFNSVFMKEILSTKTDKLLT